MKLDSLVLSALRSQGRLQVRINRQLRVVLSLGLALFIFLPSLTFSASAHSGTTNLNNDYFLLYQAANGDVVCREANAGERTELEKISPRNLRQINHLEGKSPGLSADADNAVQHLTIILRATANLEANAPAKAAFVKAASNWENIINSPVTIYIDADVGPDNFGQPWGSGVLGSTSSPSINATYSVVRNNLIAGATADRVGVYNALPTTTVPVDVSPGSSASVSVSSSIARAIGLLDPTAQPDDGAAKIGFNSTRTFDFDNSDGVTSNAIDFESVATHEIGHALGFTSRSGGSTAIPTMWDLYRFRSGTTDATFTSATRIMTIGGPTANSQYYFVPGSTEVGLSDGGPNGATTNNADGNQSSHWRQASLNNGVFIGIMDPRIPSGVARTITATDVGALNIFGYNSNAVPPPPPPANDNFAAAQVISGCSGSVNGTNLGATREAGEPNHLSSTNDPTGGGSRSVWYQWQAPSSGSATITTAGSAFDTVLGVYTGTSVGSLTVIGQGDDNPADPTNDKTSVVTFNATAGTIYRIAVDGYNNGGLGGDVGPITLNWSETNCSVAVNQIDDSTFFVHQHYVDFLNREPDTAGLNFWVNEINSCGSDAACIEVKRINVSAAFFLSIEFQETGYLVYRIYKTSFGNLPGAPVPVVLSDFLRDSQAIGQNVQVGVGNWQAQLEANKQAFALAFVQRADFMAAFPNSMTAAQFVAQLNTRAGGVLSADEQTNLVNILGGTPADTAKRAQVLRAVAEDPDLKAAEFNKAFVLMQYFGYLRRNPSDPPDSNFDGYNFWLAKLNQFNGDFVAAEMVKAFISSAEYRHRFGP